MTEYSSKWTPEFTRAYMRQYMRDRRAGKVRSAGLCLVCKKQLAGRQKRLCSRHCRYVYYRNAPLDRARHAAWYQANKERARERVVQWKSAHQDRLAGYTRKWRQSGKCPFCGDTMYPYAGSCRRCMNLHGCLCKQPNCGVVDAHKHCPCGMPVESHGKRKIEPCAYCRSEMKRFGVSLAGLFTRSAEEDEELAA